MDRGRRKFASPRKKTAVSDHQISPLLILRPNDPFAPRAIVQATWGPVHASVTRPVASSTLASTTWPASSRLDQTLTVQTR